MRDTRVYRRVRIGSEGGFTLIELLVVVLILGLLVVIAVPSFFNQRNKANDAVAKTDARIAMQAMETFATENAGSYEGATVDDLVELEPALIDTTVVIDETGESNFSISVVSGAGNRYSIERRPGGGQQFLCDPPGIDGCPQSGSWSGA